MQAPDQEYPSWLYEAAYVHGDELALLADRRDEPASEQDTPTEYVSIVFQDGTDADEALALLEREGPDAAVAHLAQWDFGEESELTAHAYGHVYRDPPAGRDDRTYVQGEYVLSWNQSLWHVGLARRVRSVPIAGDEPPSLEPHAAAAEARRVLPVVGQSVARASRRQRVVPSL